ncbi:MAG: hypothetical protein JXB85_16250 [Anaerolineales bacterium]|nr:hypothetical protein [Anaerolineales bacterium]
MITRFLRNRFSPGGRQARGQGHGGGGRGGGTKPGSGPGGTCICPKCGKKIPHTPGTRCVDKTCPDCGTRMIRE